MFERPITQKVILGMVSILAACLALALESPGVSVDTLTQIAAKYRARVNASAFVISVGYRDGRFFSVADGSINSSGGRKAKTTDRIMIGSVSKVVTAALTGKMVEKGALNWDTKLGAIFPEMKGTPAEANTSATIAQVLSHRGGLGDPFGSWVGAPGLTAKTYREKYLSEAFKMTPTAAPGQSYKYSGGANLIAIACERATGTEYEQLTQETVFRPAKLNSFGMGRPWSSVPEGSILSEVMVNGKLAEAPAGWNPHRKFDAAGGWYCSIDDLCRFGMLHFKGSKEPFFKTTTLAQLFSPQGSEGTGMAWATSKTWVSHGGCSGLGDAAVLFVEPNAGISFAFAFNRNSSGNNADPGITEIRNECISELIKLVQ